MALTSKSFFMHGYSEEEVFNALDYYGATGIKTGHLLGERKPRFSGHTVLRTGVTNGNRYAVDWGAANRKARKIKSRAASSSRRLPYSKAQWRAMSAAQRKRVRALMGRSRY